MLSLSFLSQMTSYDVARNTWQVLLAVVKFNNMSFRCKVKTGQNGLADFMVRP